MLFRGWDLLIKDLPEFLQAFFLVTIKVAAIGAICALVLGVLFGLLSSSRHKIIRFISRCYVELFQNTPVLIQVFFVYIGLPYLGFNLDSTIIAVIIISLYHGAYISEVVRSGIESVPRGQYEAATSQGFSYLETMIYIILPQTVRMILPPLTTQIVNLIKNTSILQVIAGGDLMYVADCWAANTGITVPPYLVATVLYFAICYPLTCLSRHFEKKSLEGYKQKEKVVEKEVIMRQPAMVKGVRL